LLRFSFAQHERGLGVSWKDEETRVGPGVS
jgi:hypothetical protein